jgi:thiol-disulfide isomerase/thioredoxin
MLRHCSVGICLVLSVAMMAASAQGTVSPAQLGALNFCLYQRPCPANDMTLTSLQGGSFHLSSLRGKVVILNFWKIDCPPCRMEKPILERIYRKYGHRGLVIVAVNLADDPSQIAQYRRHGGYTFIFACDPNNRLCLQQHMLGSGLPTTFVLNSKREAIYEVPAVPTTYVINRQGKIVGHSVGMVQWEQGPFAELLESLLGRPRQRIAKRVPISEPAVSRPMIPPEAARASATVSAMDTPVEEPKPAGKIESSPGNVRTASNQTPEQRIATSLKDSVPVAPEPVTTVPQKPPPLPFQGSENSESPSKPRARKPKIIHPEPKASTVKKKPRRTPAASTRQRRQPQPRPDDTLSSRYQVQPYPAPRRPGTRQPAASPRTGLYPPPPAQPGRDYRTSNQRRTAPGVPQVRSRNVPSERDYRRSSGNRPPAVGPPATPLGISGRKPALPPALPYVPSRSRVYSVPRQATDLRSRETARPPRAEFDRNGYVTARIPGSPGRSRAGSRSPNALTTPPGLREPREQAPLSDRRSYGTGRTPSGNPIEGFVLDSFGNRRPTSSVPVGPQQPMTRPRSGSTSLFGSLLDIGSGVKNSISRILPLQ